MIHHVARTTISRPRLAWWSSMLAALLVASFSLATPARAGGVVGTGTTASCTEAALDAALAGGGTIIFNCDGSKTFTITSEKVITQDTVIQGVSGANHLIGFSGGGATRLFRVVAPAKLTLSDLTIEKGYNPNDGGALLNNGTLVLNNVQVQNNKSDTCGGALWTQGAAIISNSRFEKNSAVSGGGAICTSVGGSPSVEITGGRFQDNRVAQDGNNGGYGGAISINRTGTLAVDGAEFWDNKAQFGGALAVLPSASATVRGTLGVASAHFRYNIATHSGGAIYNLGSLDLTDAEIGFNFIREDITVNGYGAGVASLGTLKIRNSFFYVNEGLTGGGLYLAGGLDNSRADIQRVEFKQNRAKGSGGGIFADNTNVAITDTTVDLNGAGGSGGGIACAQCARLQLSNSSVITNTAAYGGGLYVSAAPVSGYAHVESVTFSGNQSTTSRGGGVYNQGNLELYWSTLANNTNGVHSVSGANTRLRSTVLHNPGYTNCGSEGTVQISNDAANHIADDSCGPQFTAKGDPKLGPLQAERQEQYWFTYYKLPLAGSPLINLGHSACPQRDQRGALRPDACDIGAVEYGGMTPPPPTPSAPPSPFPSASPSPSPSSPSPSQSFRAYVPLTSR